MISHTQAFDKRNFSSKERGCLKTKVPETRNGKGKNRNTVKPQPPRRRPLGFVCHAFRRNECVTNETPKDVCGEASETPPYGRLCNMVTSLLRLLFFGMPGKNRHTFSCKKKPVVNAAKFFQSIGDHITGFPCTTKQRIGNEATDRDRARGFSRFSFYCSPTLSVQ